MNIFRILGNALVFFLSSKQRQIIRKQKQIRKQKRERKLPGPTYCAAHLAWPCAGPAHLLLPCRLPPPARRTARARRAHARAPATSCFLPLPPHRPGPPSRRHAAPTALSSLSLSPLALSPAKTERHRASSPTPIAVPAAIATALPLRAVHVLRLICLFLLNDSPGLGRAASSSPSPFPSPATKAPRRSIRHYQCAPEPANHPCRTAVSPSSFPLTSLSRACPVAAAPRAPEAAVRHGR